MPESNKSKPFSKAFDPMKDTFKKLMEGKDAKFMDLDLFTYNTKVGWVLIEWLRCDTVPPRASHPSRYLHKNWRKFWQLYNMARDLNGRLYLVNYNEQGEEFKLMRVRRSSPKVIETDDEVMSREQFKTWLHKLNDAAEQKDFDKYDVIEI